MIGLYNDGDGGVVCRNEKDGYIDLIAEKMGGKARGKVTYTPPDTYPSSMDLTLIRYMRMQKRAGRRI